MFRRGIQVCNISEQCMRSEPPSGFILLPQMTIWKQALRPYLFGMLSIFLTVPIFAIILWPIVNDWQTSFVVAFVISLFLMFWLLSEVTKMRNFPLSVNNEHPWSGIESDGGRAEVMLWTPEKKWFKIEDATIRAARDPLSNNWMFLANDAEGTRFGEIVGVSKRRMQWFSQIVNISILQAQLANGESFEDSFADAREREEHDTGLLDREWGNTTPGVLLQDNILTGGLREALSTRSQMRKLPSTDTNDSEE